MQNVSLKDMLDRFASVMKVMMAIHLWAVMTSMNVTTEQPVEEMLFVSTHKEALIVAVSLITTETHLKDVIQISHQHQICAAQRDVDPMLSVRMANVCV